MFLLAEEKISSMKNLMVDTIQSVFIYMDLLRMSLIEEDNCCIVLNYLLWIKLRRYDWKDKRKFEGCVLSKPTKS